MVADSDHSSLPARRLAERLRDFRERVQRYPEAITQRQLAKVLGGPEALSVATISLWEKPGSDQAASTTAASHVRQAVLHQPVLRFRHRLVCSVTTS